MPSDFIHAFFSDEPESPQENSERSIPGVPDEQQLTEKQLAEADRIAKELVKLRAAGAIEGPDDPEARFYASLLHTFGAEFTGKRDPKNPKTNLREK